MTFFLALKWSRQSVDWKLWNWTRSTKINYVVCFHGIGDRWLIIYPSRALRLHLYWRFCFVFVVICLLLLQTDEPQKLCNSLTEEFLLKTCSFTNFKRLLLPQGVFQGDEGGRSCVERRRASPTEVVKVRPNAIDWTKCSAENGRCLNQCRC